MRSGWSGIRPTLRATHDAYRSHGATVSAMAGGPNRTIYCARRRSLEGAMLDPLAAASLIDELQTL
jgi:hypothetical protein